MASCSRGSERDIEKFRGCLAVLESFCQDPKRQGLDARDRFTPAVAVAECAGQVAHFGNPSAVFFALQLDGKTHTHSRYFSTPRSRERAARRYHASVNDVSLDMAGDVPKRNVAREILGGLRELKRGSVGRVINVPSVTEIRERTGLSQSKFAALLGVSVRTLQEWEQGRRAPSGAARTLLMIAAKNPTALLDVA